MSLSLLVRNALILAAVTILSVGCGAAGVPTPIIDLTGNWSGTWASSRGSTGGVDAQISQSGSSLTGMVTVTGSPAGCFTSGSISGNVSGQQVNFSGTVSGGGQQINFSGTISGQGTIISGTYSVSGGLCNGDTGSFVLGKQ